jgi:hypothetical protein
LTEKKRLSPPTSPPKIEVVLGFKSTWNFQSINVNIGLTDEVREEEDVNQALDRIYGWVEKNVVEKTVSTKAELEKVYVKPAKRK